MKAPTDPVQAAVEKVARELLTMPTGWQDQLANDVVIGLGPILTDVVRGHLLRALSKERGHDEMRMLKEYIAEVVAFLSDPGNVTEGGFDYALELADQLRVRAERVPDRLPPTISLLTGDPEIDLAGPIT